jgi:hypothetical protein
MAVMTSGSAGMVIVARCWTAVACRQPGGEDPGAVEGFADGDLAGVGDQGGLVMLSGPAAPDSA